jgi:hypothetical protein
VRETQRKNNSQKSNLFSESVINRDEGIDGGEKEINTIKESMTWMNSCRDVVWMDGLMD